MKKIFPLVASMLLLASCSGGAATSSSTPAASPSAEATSSKEASEESSTSANFVLTSLADSEIYIDFNFTTAPEGLSVKIGDTTLTASGKVKMTKGFTYEIGGAFGETNYIYNIVDTGLAAAGGASTGLNAEKSKELLDKYLKKFSSGDYYEYRIYICLTDQARGWSKTMPGVDDTLKNFTPVD